MPESKLIPLTGLWLNQAKDGSKYFSGNLGNAKILIFKNKKKPEGSKAPDYQMFLAPKEQQRSEGQSGDGVNRGTGQRVSPHPPPGEEENLDIQEDNIPF